MRLFKLKKAGPQFEPAAAWTYQFRDQLPSQDDHLAFSARVRLEWSVEDPPQAAGISNLIAARHVRQLVEQAAANSSVLRMPAAEQDMNLVLVASLPCSIDGVRVHRAQVRLEVDDGTLEAARRLQLSRHDQALDSLHQERLRARMRFMRAEALRDPAAARLYLLLEHPNHPNPVAQTKALEELVEQVNLWSKQDRWITVAQLLQQFIESLPDSRRDRLIDQLGKVFVEYGRSDLAAQLPEAPVAPSTRPTAAEDSPVK